MNVRRSSIPVISLISAEFLSLLGNQVAAIAIPILVLQYTHSAIVTGIAVAGNAVPFVIAAFIGGKAVDQFGAWRVSVLADLLSCLSVLVLPLAFMLSSNNLSAAIIFLLVFTGALFDPTGVAARNTLVPALTRFAGKRLDKMNALRGGLEHTADFIGPVVGVGLIGLIGIHYTFFANALSFLFCAVLFACAVPKKRNKTKSYKGNNIFLVSVLFLKITSSEHLPLQA